MKKFLLVGLCVLSLVGCNQATELEIVKDFPETSVVVYDKNANDNAQPPFCGSIFTNKQGFEGWEDEEITLSAVWNSFTGPSNFKDDAVRGAFENDEFSALVAEADVMNFCVYWKTFAFSIFTYSDFESRVGVNVAGAFDGEKLIKEERDFSPMGDLYACGIVGLAGSDLIYNCGGGDGAFSSSKIYSLNLESGQSKTLKDCEVGPESDTCNVNVFE